MEKETTLQIIDRVARRMHTLYLFWGFLYVTLGLLSVILPILITVGALADYQHILPPLTAVVAAAFAFLKPHEYATGYDAGTQEAWKTRIAYSLGQLNDAEVSASLGRAIDVTTFKYGGNADNRAPDSADLP
jgi:hypothetical protein